MSHHGMCRDLNICGFVFSREGVLVVFSKTEDVSLMSHLYLHLIILMSINIS